MTLALLHTAAAHVATFDRLIDRRVPVRHLVRADLLSEALREGGVGPGLAARVGAAVDEASSGGGLVLCTCSTIAGAAEAAGAMRVDRPMAEAAVRLGRRILVAACVAPTLAPTAELIRAVAAGKPVELRTALFASAWRRFEAGDRERYAREVADGIRGEAGDADVVVLAQASMAGAVPHLAGLGIPILSSPELAVEAALQRMNERP